MENISIQLVLIAIIIAVLGAMIARTISRKKKRTEMFEETKKKYENIQELLLESNEGLERSEQISKNEDSITLFNKWYKEFKEIEVEMNDIDTDYADVVKAFERSNHKDFLALDKSVGYKIDSLTDRLKLLHQNLFNFTSYEFENTQIGLEIKGQLKELQNKFEINLKIKEIYTESFNNECEKIDSELIRFEDLQKSGDYTKARKHLKNATSLINQLEFNYDLLVNMIEYIDQLDTNISIIDQVREQITAKKFRLDEDEHLQNYDGLIAEKQGLEQLIDSLNFTDPIEEEFVQEEEKKLIAIQDEIFNIKKSIEEQYRQIKIIEENITMNEELLAQSDMLVTGALEERDEINRLYQMPHERAIQKLEIEVDRYVKFKKDYQVLLDLVYDLKEDYDSLVVRIRQSNEYIKHFITNIKLAIEGLGEIRSDEISALENIDSYKKRITTIDFYISTNNHSGLMSDLLREKMEDTYAKIGTLDELLKAEQLDISSVRKHKRASETLLSDLEKQAEEEIRAVAIAKNLIRFANRFIDDREAHDIISNCYTTLFYNSHNYEKIMSVIYNHLQDNFENHDALYRQIISESNYQTFSQFRKVH